MSFNIRPKENMDVEFIMLVGLPGSGKSTYVNEPLYKMVYNIHSSDNLREELYNDANNQNNNEKIFSILLKRIREDLEKGKSCILDATNISRKRRKHFLSQLNDINCKKTAIVVATPYEECLINNNKRSRKVPKEVIDKMYRNFNIPFYDEGWDEIDLYYPKQEYKGYYGNFYKDFVEKYRNKTQNNPHHSLSLGEHCIKCWFSVDKFLEDTLITKDRYDEVRIASFLHDCGKVHTESIDEEGTSHYYNHENVGSYNSLFYESFEGRDRLFISALIGFHMLPYKFNKMKESKVESYKRSLKHIGYDKKHLQRYEDFYEALMLLHIGDKLSH